jgi:hypothetical protein
MNERPPSARKRVEHTACLWALRNRCRTNASQVVSAKKALYPSVSSFQAAVKLNLAKNHRFAKLGIPDTFRFLAAIEAALTGFTPCGPQDLHRDFEKEPPPVPGENYKCTCGCKVTFAM